MAEEYGRIERIAEVIRHELSRLLTQEVKDPRLMFITISNVKVSRDLSYAKIYFTQISETQTKDIKNTLRTLDKAKGHLRYHLARNLNLRITPELKFFFDEDLERAMRLSELINEAVAKDKHS